MGRNLKCNLPPERQEEVFGYFENGYGFSLDLAEETQMQSLMPQYLFYDSSWTEKNIRVCHCTNCGGFDVYRNKSTAAFFGHSSGDDCDCPNCGQGVELKALGRMRSFASVNDIGERRFSIFRGAPDGGLLVISGWGRRRFSFNDLSPDVEFTEKERQYFAPGVRMRWKRVWRYDGLCGTGTAHPAGWEACEYMAEPHNPTINLTSDGSYYVICAERIEDTKLKYCRLEDWYHDRCKVWLSDTSEPARFVHKFLSLYTEYPNMEMACRLGFWDAVDDLVDHGKKNARVLDWNAKTSWGFLRLSKTDGKAFLKCDGGMDDLKLLAAARKWDKELTLAKFWELVEACGNDEGVATLALHASNVARVSPQVVIHYLSAGSTPASRKPYAQMLCDYLDYAKILKYDLRQRDVALPKNLKERHDAASAAVMILRQKEACTTGKYARRVKAVMQMYEFAYGGYSIIAPSSVEDIVNEGKRLHHCVGGYADRHFNGKLEILFLRKTTDIGKPLITMELQHRAQPTSKVIIRQMCGDHNCAVKHKFQWFLDVWMQWLLSGSPRDKEGAPIIEEYEEVSA